MSTVRYARGGLGHGLHRLVHHRRQAPLQDLVHGVPAKPLAPHPLEVLGCRPRSAQADLDDLRPAQHPLFHGHPEGRPMGQAHAVERGRGVGVGVEMQHGVSVGSVPLGQRAHRGQGERVVAPEHERHGAGGQYLSQPPLQRTVRALKVGRRDLSVAVVHHSQHLERIESEGHVGASIAPAVVGRANRPRPVPRTRAVRGAVIERGAEDGHVRALEPAWLVDERTAAEGGADPGVGGSLAGRDIEAVRGAHGQGL